MQRHGVVVRHSAEEDAAAGVEAAGKEFALVVPLAHAVSTVARLPQQLREGGDLRIHRIRRDIRWVRREYPKQRTAGH